MPLLIRLARAALLLGLLPAAAAAQLPVMPVFDSGTRTIGLQLGSAQPTSTHGFRQVAKAGIGVNISALQYLADWVAGGLELGFNQFGKNGRGSADALNAGLLARVNLLRNSSWTPYLTGGLGYHATNVKIDSTFNGAPACSPVTGDCGADQNLKGSGTSVSGGIGVEAFLFQGLSVSFESRFREYRFSGTGVEALNIALGVHVWLAPKENRR